MDEEITITKEELSNLNEDNVLLITYPGRMGDVDGCSFAYRDNDGVKIYRIDDLYSFEDSLYNQFPKWEEALQGFDEQRESDKYHIVYMGMGNLLGVDKSIYDILNNIMIEKEQEEDSNLDYELHLGMTYYTYWRSVIKDMYK